MNEMTTIPQGAVTLALPDAATVEDWLGLGRDLFTQRRQVDWLLADWVATGIDRFGDQLQLALIGGDLGVEPKFLTAAAKTAAAFPHSQRDTALTLEHHIHVADLPADERLSVLKRAHEEHWTAKQTRVEVMKRKVASGQTTIFSDDDFEHHELMAITRAWNRARSSVRQSFMELAGEAELGDIDA
jgi:hypothetical protein